MKRLVFIAVVLVIGLFMARSSAIALNFSPTDPYGTIADGEVGAGEWDGAAYEEDGPGANAGAMYAMWSNNYSAGSRLYDGTFQYLLHNIEQLTTKEDADYNVFDFYTPGNPNDLMLRLWVFNEINNDDSSDIDWLIPAGLNDSFGSIDDRGFLVYNYGLDEYRQYLPEYGSPEDSDYNWGDYWGIYAAGSYNNSAYTAGLDLAIDNYNEVYEVIYLNPGGYTDEGIRRSIKDPDDIPQNPIIDYWDGELVMTPEPSTCLLLLFGVLGLLGIKKKTS